MYLCIYCSGNITDHTFFFLFHVRSSTATTSCEDGRATVVIMRCNPNKPDQGELSVPRYLSVCVPVVPGSSFSTGNL